MKNHAYAGLVRSFTDMENVATMLAWYEMFGDYHIFLRWADMLDKVSAADVQKAAKETFVREKSVAGFLLKNDGVVAAKEEKAPAKGGVKKPAKAPAKK